MGIFSLLSPVVMVSLVVYSRVIEGDPIRSGAVGHWENSTIVLEVVNCRQLVSILSRVLYERVGHCVCVSCYDEAAWK